MKWIGYLTLSILVTGTACRQDMHDQPKYNRLKPSTFFDDGRTMRPIPAHTIARGELDDTDLIHTGLVQTGQAQTNPAAANLTNDVFADAIPVPVNLALLERGKQRYEIYCTPCHGYLGDGDGMIARRGFMAPANLQSERVRELPPGYVFQVISNGFGSMPDYSDQIFVNDRWAIVAYLRALELSQNATLEDVPPQQRASLNSPPKQSPAQERRGNQSSDNPPSGTPK